MCVSCVRASEVRLCVCLACRLFLTCCWTAAARLMGSKGRGRTSVIIRSPLHPPPSARRHLALFVLPFFIVTSSAAADEPPQSFLPFLLLSILSPTWRDKATLLYQNRAVGTTRDAHIRAGPRNDNSRQGRSLSSSLCLRFVPFLVYPIFAFGQRNSPFCRFSSSRSASHG
jgi:hypothetical protein